jgi:hypothetical protein
MSTITLPQRWRGFSMRIWTIIDELDGRSSRFSRSVDDVVLDMARKLGRAAARCLFARLHGGAA